MPEEPTQRIPRSGRTLPTVPATTPPVVPVSQRVREQRDIGLDIQRQPPPRDRFRELLGPFAGLGNLLQRNVQALYGVPELYGLGRPPTATSFPPRGVTRERFLRATQGYEQAPSRLALGVPENVPLTQADLPTPLVLGAERIRAHRPTGKIRAYWFTASSLMRGINPKFISFLAEEALDLPEDWMNEFYVKVAGGWVRREVLDQPLQTIYGSGTAAQPQTINVNYGGYGGGGGGGGVSRQSSYLVNWRI